MGTNLAQRVEQNAQSNGAAKAPTVYSMIEAQKSEIARALPKHMDADRLARIAITVIKQTPALGNCDPISLVGALMTCSQLGLEPGPLGEAYLVPFGRQVTFIPGYRGLIKLAWQSGMLEEITAKVVRERDHFEYSFGLNAKLEHVPARGERGAVTDVWALAKFKNGGHAYEVMSVADVEKIRARSKASKSGPWVTDWDAMAKKTVIKQLMKFVPLSPELHNVATAALLDGTTRTDLGSAVGEITPAPGDYEVIDGEVVDTGTGEVLEPSDEEIAAFNAEAAADPQNQGD